MKQKLTIKTAIITGASSGIGFEITKQLVICGVDVVMVARNKINLQKAKNEINNKKGGKIICISTDIRKKINVDKMIFQAKKELKNIDCLINSVGVSIHGRFEDVKERDWDEVVETNLKGVFLCCNAVWSTMKKNKFGQIITISSASGLSGYVSGSIYCASKFGVNGLMNALSLEGQEDGIKVTTICPGQVNTSIWNPDDLIINKAKKDMLQPKAIADLVCYVLSRPNNEHFRNIVLHPFKIQPNLRGRNRGPGGKFII